MSCLRSYSGSSAISCSSNPLQQFQPAWVEQVSVLCVSLFCVPLCAQVIPRRGWQELDVPSGWVRVLRGPRPKSEQWPAANAKKPASLPKNRWRREQSIPTQPGLWKLPPPRPPSRAPEVVAAEATEEVRRLEAAVSALGEGNAHSKPLLKALEVARARSHIEPVDKRIDSCKSFLERARKRAGRLEAVIARATTEKDVCLQEIVESERRLGQLEVQARVRPTQVDAQVEVSVGVLQEKIDVFCRRSGMFCWPQPPQFCRGQPQCGWEMVHLRWTTFLRCRAPMSRTWNTG